MMVFAHSNQAVPGRGFVRTISSTVKPDISKSLPCDLAAWARNRSDQSAPCSVSERRANVVVKIDSEWKMLRIFRFLSITASGLSIASAVIVTLFSVLILLQSCLGDYRQQHPQLDINFDSIGLPIMSWVLVAMTWRLAMFGRNPGDCSLDRVWLTILLFWGSTLTAFVGASLFFAVSTCNRYAEIWSHCRAVADTG
jgi:hypothetical protein